MKICLINNLYKPYDKGGAEKVTLTIARGLLNAGHEVLVITAKPYFSKLPTGSGRDLDGLRVYYLNSLYFNLAKLPKLLRFFWHLWDMFNLLNYFKIKIILEIQKPDAGITNNLMGLGYLTGLALRKLKVKQLHIVHDIQLIHPSGILCYGEESKIDAYFSRNYAGLSSLIFGSPPVVIFPSRWLRDRYLDSIFFIKSKRIVLTNPVAFKPLAARKKDYDIFKFLYLGQIEKHKGVNLLVQAFDKVKSAYPQSVLIIAGDGSELETIKNEAKDGVNFLGRQDEAQVAALLMSCDCLVIPTLCYENCPAAILEAFSAGLPVIAADLGGASELLGQDAGVLFRPGNAADLAKQMQWAIAHPDELAKLAEIGRAKAAASSVDNYIKELEELMKKIKYG